jgi:hypothetical protein
MVDSVNSGKLAAYPSKGPNVSMSLNRFKVHSLSKENQKKQFGVYTKKAGFITPASTFGANQKDASKQSSSAFSVGDPGGPSLDRDRFKVFSLPKESVKKLHALHSNNIDFIPAQSTMGPKKAGAANLGVLSNINQEAAFSFDGGSHKSTRDRFKYDSLPKETVKKQFGEFTRTIDFIAPKSCVLPGKVASSDPNMPEFSIGGPKGPSDSRNRFKYDSLPKETVKKYFGVETSHLGFVDAPSFFGGKTNPLSVDPTEPRTMLGDPNGPNAGVDRFKFHSLPKETVKKLHGIFTRDVDFVDATTSFSPKTCSFSKGSKLSNPLGGATQVVDDHFWRMRVRSEQAVIRKGMSMEDLLAAKAAAAGLEPEASQASSTARRTPRADPAKRLGRYDQSKKQCKTPQAFNFLGTLKNLDSKLQKAKSMGDLTAVRKTQKAIQSLKQLKNVIETKQANSIKYRDLLAGA